MRINPEQEFVPEKMDYPDHRCPECGHRGIYISKIKDEEQTQEEIGGKIYIWQVMVLKCPACGFEMRHARVMPQTGK